MLIAVQIFFGTELALSVTMRDSAGCGGNSPGAAKKMFSGSFD